MSPQKNIKVRKVSVMMFQKIQEGKKIKMVEKKRNQFKLFKIKKPRQKKRDQ